jgi:hypothetical protein
LARDAARLDTDINTDTDTDNDTDNFGLFAR